VNGSSKRLRVLFMIDHAGALGGAERFVTGLALHVPRERIEPWVCSTRCGEPHAVVELQEAGGPHLNRGSSSKLHVRRLSKLVAVMRRERFDVVHAHKFGSNLWGSTIGRACGVPVIIAHEHNWSYTGDRLRAFLDGQVIGRLATRFIAVSEANRRRMVELEGVPADKIIVLPTAYIPHSAPANGDIRAELGLASDAPLVGVAAGLRTEKALEVMLEAHSLLGGPGREAHLVIAGDGPCQADLQRRARGLGIRERVHFLGERRDVDSILRSVDVGAMSSDWEGMPLFVFECMATDTPLVATAVGGLTDIVQNGTTGLLVPPRDPQALASALTSLLADRPLARRIAAAASARLDQFTIKSVAARFTDLYEQLSAQAGVR